MPHQHRLRRISIASVQYFWRVASIDPQHVLLKVWAANRSRRDFPLEVRLRFDDPWLNFGPIVTAPPERVHEVFQLAPITPAVVREIVEVALHAGWNPLDPQAHRRFVWSETRELIPIAD